VLNASQAAPAAKYSNKNAKTAIANAIVTQQAVFTTLRANIVTSAKVGTLETQSVAGSVLSAHVL